MTKASNAAPPIGRRRSGHQAHLIPENSRRFLSTILQFEIWLEGRIPRRRDTFPVLVPPNRSSAYVSPSIEVIAEAE